MDLTSQDTGNIAVQADNSIPDDGANEPEFTDVARESRNNDLTHTYPRVSQKTISGVSDSSKTDLKEIKNMNNVINGDLKTQGFSGQSTNDDSTSSGHQSEGTDLIEKSGSGEVSSTEPRVTQETTDEDSDLSEPVLLDIPQSSDFNSGNVKPQGVSPQVANGVSKPSGCHSGRIPEETSTSGERSHEAVMTEKRLVASFTPLDETYIKATVEKCEGDLLFLDTQGSHRSAARNTNSNGPITVDLSDDDSFNNKEYREHSDSSVSEMSSFESDSEIEIEIEEIFRKGPHLNSRKAATTHGELTLKDLPPIQDLKISVDEKDCLKVGNVSSIVEELVVIQALPNTPALDLGTVLFLESGRQTLGEVFDVFGQVKEPYYTVRFNSADHARNRGVKEGVEVYCAPKTKYTSYVFVYEMLKLKGSDASWEHNQEPPENCVDFSDDEEERAARKRKNRNKKKNDGSEVNTIVSRLSSEEESESISVESTSCMSDHPQAIGSTLQAGPSSGESSHLPSGSRTPKSTSSSDIHWRDVLPKAMAPKAVIGPSIRDLPNSQMQSCLHPPGHPPLRSRGFQEWLNSESALKAARRVNRHLYRNHPLYQKVLEGAYPPPRVPAPTASQVTRTYTSQPPAEGPRMWTSTPQPHAQGPRSSFLPTPETPHQRPPLLPSPNLSPLQSPQPSPLPSPLPNHWPFVTGPLNPLASTLPDSSQSASVPFNSADSKCVQSFTRPPPIPPSQIRPLMGPNHPTRHLLCPDLPATYRPVPSVPTQPPISSSPLCGLPCGSRLNVPPPSLSLFSFASPYERRNSVPPSFPPPSLPPPSLPPPSHPPFISSGQMRPFMLRPSSLFPRFPPNSGT